MSQRLVHFLSRCSADDLRRFVANWAIALADLGSPGANSAPGLAQLIVSQYTADGVLRDSALRSLVIASLGVDEARELCNLVDVPNYNPAAVLQSAFASLGGSSAETLFSWFNVSYEPAPSPSIEPSRRARPPRRLQKHQADAYRDLRRRLSDGSGNILVHMPPGAGKLRAVATAIVDLFRSMPDTQTVVWCAKDESLCEDAFEEIFSVWEDLGSRDVTIYRLFGTAPMQDLRMASGGIAILDLVRLRDQITTADPDAVARNLRCVVLSDALDALDPEVGEWLAGLREPAPFSVIGLLSASGGYLGDRGLLPSIREFYGPVAVELPHDDPIAFLTGRGAIAGIKVAPLRPGDAAVRVPDARVADAASTVDLNRCHILLELLERKRHQGECIVFYADSAAQARGFVGVLNCRGIKAVSVTGEMGPDQRRQEVKRFQNGTSAHVLCVHGILVSGSEVPKARSLLIANPAGSLALYGAMVGRFADGRDVGAVMDVTILDDGAAGWSELIAHVGKWASMEASK